MSIDRITHDRLSGQASIKGAHLLHSAIASAGSNHRFSAPGCHFRAHSRMDSTGRRRKAGAALQFFSKRARSTMARGQRALQAVWTTGWWSLRGVTHNAFMVRRFKRYDWSAACMARSRVSLRRALLGNSPRAKSVSIRRDKAGCYKHLPEESARVPSVFGFGS